MRMGSKKRFEYQEIEFVKSPIGLVPPHGYSGSDTHSKESMNGYIY